MANRFFQQFRFSLEKYVVDLWAHVSFGAAGAPTLDVANSKGIASISRVSAGLYDIELQDSYYKFLMAQSMAKSASAPAAPLMHLVSEQVGDGDEPKLQVQFTDSTGVATDPASGEEAYMQFSLSNSSAV